MNGAGEMAVGPFAFLANVDEDKLLTRIDAAFNVGNVGFLDAFFRVVDEREKFRACAMAISLKYCRNSLTIAQRAEKRRPGGYGAPTECG